MNWDGVKIGEALRRSAKLWPEREFVVDSGERLSYARFDAEVDRLATGLLGLGVGRGDHVACWLTNGPDWLRLWFACCRIGATVVSINTRYKTDEVAFILAQSDAKVLVAMPGYWNIDYLAMIREKVPGFEASTPGALQCDALPELRAVLLWMDERHPGTGLARATDGEGGGYGGAGCSRRRTRRHGPGRHHLHLRHHGRAQGRDSLPPGAD